MPKKNVELSTSSSGKARSNHSANPASTVTSNSTPQIDWPKFSPLIPDVDLTLEELLPGQIYTISRLWTSALCKAYVNFLGSLPMVTTPGRPKRGEAVRVNDRFQVNDEGFAERLWKETALSKLIVGPHSQLTDAQQTELWGGEVIGLSPNIRVYRYSKGQFFAQHYDDTCTLKAGTPPVNARTTWTLLLYLTSPVTGCIGGQTVFYPENPVRGKAAAKTSDPDPLVVELEVGLALLHKHGFDCLLHEGYPVQDGVKWVIRSDLCVRA